MNQNDTGIDMHVMSASKFGSGLLLGAVLGVDSALTRNMFLTPAGGISFDVPVNLFLLELIEVNLQLILFELCCAAAFEIS